MLLSVEVPDLIAKHLRLDGPQRSRRALEIFALEGYREGKLSRGQVSEMLDMGFHDTEAFLKENDAYISMTMEEFEQERQVLKNVLGQ